MHLSLWDGYLVSTIRSLIKVGSGFAWILHSIPYLYTVLGFVSLTGKTYEVKKSGLLGLAAASN